MKKIRFLVVSLCLVSFFLVGCGISNEFIKPNNDKVLEDAGDIWGETDKDKPFDNDSDWEKDTDHKGVQYYVDGNYGSDDNDGKSVVQAFKTLKVASLELKEGDTLNILPAVYNETLKPVSSGTEKSKIIYKNFSNTDKKAIISAGDFLKNNSWAKMPGKTNIWETQLGAQIVPYENFALYIGGNMQVEARWPNITNANNSAGDMNDIMMCKRAVSGKKITGTDYKSNLVVLEEDERAYGELPKDINNAYVHIWPGANGVGGWISFTNQIKSYDSLNNLITYANPFSGGTDAGGNDGYTPYDKNPYYIFGHLNLLDQENEYFYDKNEDKLYVYSLEQPQNNKIMVKARNSVINLNGKSNIIIDGIDTFGGGLNATNTNGIEIKNTTFKFMEHFKTVNGFYSTAENDGMTLIGNDNIIDNCKLSVSMGNGLRVSGENFKIINSVIEKTNYAGTQFSAIYLDHGSKNALIQNNDIKYSGRCHIFIPSGMHDAIDKDHKVTDETVEYGIIEKVKIDRNYMLDHAIFTSDNGIIYGYAVDGKGTEFTNNYCEETLNNDKTGSKYDNGKMHKLVQGLYLDSLCKNFVFESNVVINASVGIQPNSFNNGLIFKNNSIVSNAINDYGGFFGTYNYANIEGGMKNSIISNNNWYVNSTNNADAYNFSFVTRKVLEEFAIQNPTIDPYKTPQERLRITGNYKNFTDGKLVHLIEALSEVNFGSSGYQPLSINNKKIIMEGDYEFNKILGELPNGNKLVKNNGNNNGFGIIN